MAATGIPQPLPEAATIRRPHLPSFNHHPHTLLYPFLPLDSTTLWFPRPCVPLCAILPPFLDRPSAPTTRRIGTSLSLSPPPPSPLLCLSHTRLETDSTLPRNKYAHPACASSDRPAGDPRSNHHPAPRERRDTAKTRPSRDYHVQSGRHSTSLGTCILDCSAPPRKYLAPVAGVPRARRLLHPAIPSWPHVRPYHLSLPFPLSLFLTEHHSPLPPVRPCLRPVPSRCTSYRPRTTPTSRLKPDPSQFTPNAPPVHLFLFVAKLPPETGNPLDLQPRLQTCLPLYGNQLSPPTLPSCRLFVSLLWGSRLLCPAHAFLDPALARHPPARFLRPRRFSASRPRGFTASSTHPPP